ncbi:MAG: ThuA domain-containing protein [Verrucomicrobiales bacterium]|nr:ThuA domain-containing protein [Verrucomicrobiales bacterium]
MVFVVGQVGYREPCPEMCAKAMKPLSNRIVGGLLGCVAVAGCVGTEAVHGAEMKPVEPKRVLVVSVAAGFRHSAIPVGERVIAELARRSGAFTVEFIRAPESEGAQGGAGGPSQDSDGAAALRAALDKLRPESLRRYDAVVFNNTSGELPLPDKDGFLRWIADGGGFVGIHAATDTFRGRKPPDPYIQMVGAEFAWHGPQVEVEIINHDPTHPACRHLPKSFRVYEEIYLFNGFERDKVQCLLGMDRHPNTKEPGYYPVAWCKQYGRGRVFYTSLGHREDIWDPAWERGGRKNDPATAEAFQKHLLGGILWVLGLEPGGSAGSGTAGAAQ